MSTPERMVPAPERTVAVGAERLARWLAGFAERHGSVTCQASPDTVTFDAADGARARCTVPFPPLDTDAAVLDGGLTAHVLRERTVGVVLVRRGGYAAGVFRGETLIASKVGARHVQGRTAAGGQSQRRFARRREKQAREAFEAAADVVVRVVLPYADTLDAVVTGGDRTAVSTVLADARLTPLRRLCTGDHLAVPDPRLAVLRRTPARFRAVSITVTEPAAQP